MFAIQLQWEYNISTHALKTVCSFIGHQFEFRLIRLSVDILVAISLVHFSALILIASHYLVSHSIEYSVILYPPFEWRFIYSQAKRLNYLPMFHYQLIVSSGNAGNGDTMSSSPERINEPSFNWITYQANECIYCIHHDYSTDIVQLMYKIPNIHMASNTHC